jgi:NitT/TauT family transport system substrate-binding protein
MRRSHFTALSGAFLAAAPRGLQAQPRLTLRVATSPIDGGLEIYYGQQQGFFDKYGLDVTITDFKNASLGLAAVESGDLDIAFADIIALVNALDHGLPFVAVAPSVMSVAASPVEALVVLKDAPIHSGKDLNGKAIGVFGLKDVTQITAEAYIDNSGGDSSTAKYVEIPPPLMMEALMQRRVDASAIAISLFPSVIAGPSAARVLSYPFNEIAPRFLNSVWAASRPWAANNRDARRRFARAMQETARWSNLHHAETGAILLGHLKLTPDALSAMGPYRATFGDTLSAPLIQPVIDVAAKYGSISKAYRAESLL